MSAALSTDRSNALRPYPDDLLSSPLDQRAVAIDYEIAPGAAATTGQVAMASTPSACTGERLRAVVNGGDLATSGFLLAFVAASAWRPCMPSPRDTARR